MKFPRFRSRTIAERCMDCRPQADLMIKYQPKCGPLCHHSCGVDVLEVVFPSFNKICGNRSVESHINVRHSIVPPPSQMLPNSHLLFPNSGRLLVPVSEGCCRVHNADIQVIPVRPSSCSGLEVTMGCVSPGCVCVTQVVCATPHGGRSHSPKGTTPCPRRKRFNAVGLTVRLLWFGCLLQCRVSVLSNLLLR